MTVGNTPELMSVKHGSVEFGSMFDEFDTRILYPRRRIVSRAAVFLSFRYQNFTDFRLRMDCRSIRSHASVTPVAAVCKQALIN